MVESMSKILLFITVFAAVLGCVKRPSQSERQLYASDFEASQSSDDLFPGWQPKINHGYDLQQGTGRQDVGLSMNLSPGLDAKAVMVSGTLDLSQQPSVQ